MRTLRYNRVDVFTDTPLTGNPLAVFTNGVGLSDAQMQNIAREMNLSETVFFLPAPRGVHARLRIFTPRTELPFAGHPVLGSAWILGGPIEAHTVCLETQKGVIEVALERGGDRILVGWMKQPLPARVMGPESFDTLEGRERLTRALGISGGLTGVGEPQKYENGPEHVLFQLDSVDDVSRLKPDFGTLSQVTSAGVLVYALVGEAKGEGETVAVQARYFAPAAGVPEDPATGSAAGVLGAHLFETGQLRAQQVLTISQGSEMQRPSLLMVKVSEQEGRVSAVEVGGAAVVVGRGELQVP